MTAQEALTANLEEAKVLISKIQDKINTLQDIANTTNINWGQVGDSGKIVELLKQVVE